MYIAGEKGYYNPISKDKTTMFYIARNSLAVTGPMTKKAALDVWADIKVHGTGGPCKRYRIQLCKETGNMAQFNPVMNLN